MTTTEPAFQKADPPGRGSAFTWTATALACAYSVWSGAMLYSSTPKFIDMYSSLGVELSLPTRIVIATYRFGYPFLFGGAIALLIGKQFSVREKWPNLSITLGTVVAVAILGNWIVRALYRPLFDMVEKLNK